MLDRSRLVSFAGRRAIGGGRGDVGPPVSPAKCGGNKRTVDVREVVNGLLYILSAGCHWPAIPK